MIICPECETEHDKENCPECECAKQYTELENLSLKLEDELCDRLMDLERAKQSIQHYEDAVTEARKKCYANDEAMRDFKWWTAERK